MFKTFFRGILIHFSVCASALTLIFIIQYFLVYFSRTVHHDQISVSLCMEYIAIYLLWTFSVSFPIAGLFGASSLYISRFRKKNSPQVQEFGTSGFSKLTGFLMPSVVLGTLIFLVCMALMLFFLPYANTRACRIIDTADTGSSIPRSEKSDRELGLSELLQKADQLSIESGSADRQKKTELLLKKAQYMIEAYKLFAIPLLGFLLPIVGALLALMFSRLRWGQRILLFLFDIFILALVWFMLIVGETWGDRGLISPFAAMFSSPAIVAVIIAALIMRTRGILASNKAFL